MQSNLLEPNPTADLRVYAVWEPFLGATAGSIDPALLSDDRVLNVWDGSAALSDWVAANVEDAPRPAYDLYLLYDSPALWGDAYVAAGASVIGRSLELEGQLTSLLER